MQLGNICTRRQVLLIFRVDFRYGRISVIRYSAERTLTFRPCLVLKVRISVREAFQRKRFYEHETNRIILRARYGNANRGRYII